MTSQNPEIAVLQTLMKQVSDQIRDLRVDIKEQSKTYATKLELSDAIRDHDQVVQKQFSEIKHKYDPAIDDLADRKKDRRKIFWLLVSTSIYIASEILSKIFNL
jgi:gas vesicle protein